MCRVTRCTIFRNRSNDLHIFSLFLRCEQLLNLTDKRSWNTWQHFDWVSSLHWIVYICIMHWHTICTRFRLIFKLIQLIALTSWTIYTRNVQIKVAHVYRDINSIFISSFGVFIVCVCTFLYATHSDVEVWVCFCHVPKPFECQFINKSITR